jgi:hypothetical protein
MKVPIILSQAVFVGFSIGMNQNKEEGDLALK